jgi:hypothetical protein
MGAVGAFVPEGVATPTAQFATFYVAMAVAALIVEVMFAALGFVPSEHHAQVVEASISWNVGTTRHGSTSHFSHWGALPVLRFLRTGGPAMLSMMNSRAETGHAHHAH